MALDVDTDSLRRAAAALALLQKEIDQAPPLNAQPVADALPGSQVSASLNGLDQVSATAKAVLQARFNEFSGLLAMSADQFDGNEEDSADRLASVADLNSGDPENPQAAQPSKDSVK